MVKRASTMQARPQAHPAKDKGLNLMVQINDPKNVRKDLLEALREIIIFMQGYEAFRKIQEEKIAVFEELKDDVKVLNGLVDSKLRRMLPKGKLAGMVKRMPKVEVVQKEETESMPVPKPQPKMASKPVAQEEDGDLDELESQLREIESRLKNM
ncbi:MAG TPA: hypothetical protein VJB13_02080 [Candidatus Nanoarchaeia archaeon]|nr:hypothetical protein [Candidatus Nanoarchaeia archaeon]